MVKGQFTIESFIMSSSTESWDWIDPQPP